MTYPSITAEHESSVRAALARKRTGTDCTADESADIMAYFDATLAPLPPDSKIPQDTLAGELANAFPLELDQWADENEKHRRPYQTAA